MSSSNGSGTPVSTTLHAIIVAGGAGSRLASSAPCGVPAKPLLADLSGTRLIDRVLTACAGAATRVVVAGPMDLPPGVLRVREDPPLSGPAAAIGAGVTALDNAGAADEDAVLLLAADLADPVPAVTALIAHGCGNSGPGGSSDSASSVGCVASVDGRLQPLLGLVRFSALREATTTDLRNTSVTRLLRRIGLENLDILDLPTSAAEDVDTWDDALAHGYGERYGQSHYE